jgi:hypothetical protein
VLRPSRRARQRPPQPLQASPRRERPFGSPLLSPQPQPPPQHQHHQPVACRPTD